MVRRCVEAIPRGHTSFEERFPGKRRRIDEGLPPLAPWRSNLTALSQEHNLYFIAYGADIYVYEPEFPEQSIHHPVLILPSQPSSPGLTGHIDRSEPHAINYLVVEKLGKDEVIANVRDDGDVEIFLVRHILHAINTRTDSGHGAAGPIADNIKPLFQRNVGVSAWGLAIHAQARILAVSSNRHEVTVFRFGLVDELEAPKGSRRKAMLSGQLGQWEEEHGDDNAESQRERSADVTRQVLNGEANIPHIAFCNTGDDPDGRWLLTTDISGVCRAIDLHRFTLVQAFRFGPSFGMPLAGGSYDRINAGWGIMFLDTRSFVAQDSLQSALGMEDEELPPDTKSETRIWDLSKTIRHLPNISNAFCEPRLKRPVTPPRETSRSTTGVSSGASSPLGTQSTAASNITATLASVLRQAAQENHSDEEEDAGVPIEPDATSDLQDPDQEPASGEPEDEDQGLDDVELWSDDEGSDGEGTEDSFSQTAYYGGQRICGNLPQFVRGTDLCEDLPCPVLHASIRNVYLLQPSKQRLRPNDPFLPPLVGLAAPLKQSIQAEYSALNSFDRLNMHAYIPTLGVVILASQKGRAVVLSLTRISQSTELPADIDIQLGLKTIYTLRAECVLPFESQEREGQRPFSPLHGIATGPIQGTEGSRGGNHKRWRLMMMFQDHSVLSYEIRRTKGKDVGVHDLVI
ncbi:hypothetical protein Q7P37_010649 [Cladosporium fusiforme]